MQMSSIIIGIKWWVLKNSIFLWVLWVFYGIYVRVSWERGNRAIRGRDICLLLNRLLTAVVVTLVFSFPV